MASSLAADQVGARMRTSVWPACLVRNAVARSISLELERDRRSERATNNYIGFILSMKARPKAIAIIATFLFAATAIAVVVGFALLFPGGLLDWLAQFNKPGMAAFEWMGRWSGLFLLALACGVVAAAIGMLRARKWAWWFAVALFVIDGCGDLISAFVTREWLRSTLGIAVSAAFLFALKRADVGRYFN